jgi:hypothetical protein
MFLLIISSCQKLNTVPTDFITPNYYYNSEADLNKALSGIYSVFALDEMYRNMLFSQHPYPNDEGYPFRATYTSGIYVNNFDPSDVNVTSLWRACYKGIELSNSLLYNINKPAMSQTNRNVINGEALFLRGYFYFLLVSNWGDVPMPLTPTASINNVNIPKSQARDVYAQILKDMTTAEPMVQTITALGYSGHITQTAVDGILARVCLTMAGQPINDVSKYADALAWSDKVINSGLHSLNPDYTKIWINLAQDIYDVKESMWEIEFYFRPGVTAQDYGRYGGTVGISCSNLNTGYCYGAIWITGTLWNKFPSAKKADPVTNLSVEYSPDLRRDWNIGPFSYDANGNHVAFSPSSIYNRYDGKVRREYENYSPKDKNFNTINFPVLRYADVLLMNAEAENEVNGPTAKAINDVNMVRRRGWGKYLYGENLKNITITAAGTGYTTAPTVTINGGGGSGATATAFVSGGKVTAVNIATPGSFYTSTPTISFSGGGGTGAAATATITQTSDADLTATQTAGHDVLLTAIQDERARELCFEGLRKADLKRWGIYISTMKATANDIATNAPAAYKFGALGGNNTSTRHLVYPIPSYDMSLNNLLTQNPGW